MQKSASPAAGPVCPARQRCALSYKSSPRGGQTFCLSGIRKIPETGRTKQVCPRDDFLCSFVLLQNPALFSRQMLRNLNFYRYIFVSADAGISAVPDAFALKPDPAARLGACRNMAKHRSADGRKPVFAAEYGCCVWNLRRCAEIVSVSLPARFRADTDFQKQISGAPVRVHPAFSSEAYALALINACRHADFDRLCAAVGKLKTDSLPAAADGFAESDRQIGMEVSYEKV